MKFKNFAATAAAALIAVSALGAPVFAAEDAGENTTHTPQTTATIKKTVNVTNLDEDLRLTLPTGTKFSFVATPIKKNTPDANAAPDTEFTGVEGAVTFGDAVVNDDANTKRTIEFDDAAMFVDASKFPCPGLYFYTVTEAAFNVNGVTKADKTECPLEYTLKLRIDRNDEGQLVVGDMAFANGSTKVSQPKFVNNYNTDDVVVKKEIKGNQANKGAQFPFTITINGLAGQTFTAKGATLTGGTNEITLEKDGEVIFTGNLSDGGTIKIDGLTADNTYTVSEGNLQGYTPSVLVTKDDVDQKIGLNVAEGKATTSEITAMNTGDEMVVFTNTKNGTIPTGLLMTAAPYVLIAGLGGIFAVMFFRKKRED